MFGPNYFKKVGYVVDGEALCLKCAEEEFDLSGDESETLLTKAGISKIVEAEEDSYSPEGEGFSCDRCGEEIFERTIRECEECGEDYDIHDNGTSNKLCYGCNNKEDEEGGAL
jgi:hypothetical protein